MYKNIQSFIRFATIILLLQNSLFCCSVQASQVAVHSPKMIQSTRSVFARPHDLTLDPQGKKLYVSDMGNNVIKILDPVSLNLLGIIGQGELNSPHDVSFDVQGRLFVADSGNNRIAVFDVKDGIPRILMSLRRNLDSPEGVTVASDGTVYVANTGKHNIVVFNTDGSLTSFGRMGKEDSEFIRPHDIEIHNNLLYVTDPGNNRILVFHRNLKIFRKIESSELLNFDEPKYLALNRNLLFVADEGNDQIKVFNRLGKWIAVMGVECKDDIEILNKPEGVEAKDDHIWVSDTYNNRVVLYKWNRKAE